MGVDGLGRGGQGGSTAAAAAHAHPLESVRRASHRSIHPFDPPPSATHRARTHPILAVKQSAISDLSSCDIASRG